MLLNGFRIAFNKSLHAFREPAFGEFSENLLSGTFGELMESCWKERTTKGLKEYFVVSERLPTPATLSRSISIACILWHGYEDP